MPVGGHRQVRLREAGALMTGRRASQSAPYEEPIDGVDRDTDAWLEAADVYRDAEFDRQNGSEW